MQFEPSAEQNRLVERIRALCARHFTEAEAAAHDREPRFPLEAYRALGEAGVLGHCLPPPHGAGGSLVDLALVCEALGRHAGLLVSPYFVNIAASLIVAQAGSKAQKEAWLPGMADGTRRFAFGLTEPDAGSDAGAIRTRAVASGDGFVLDGVKRYTSGAQDAERILVVARTTDAPRASGGSGIFAVPREARGVRITVMDKIGGNAHATCEVQFDGVALTKDDVVGPPQGAWPILLLTAGVERVVVAAAAAGITAAMLEEIRTFLLERKQFGQPIAQFQAVRHQVADLATRAEAQRWLTYAAAARAQKEGPKAAGFVSMAKLHGAELAMDVALAGMKLLGGRAYLKETPMFRRLREAALLLYAGGTAEIQRELIARHIF